MDSSLNADQIYDVLKKKIVDLDYEPGQVLNEEDIANEHGVSRTPIRKVFQQLNADKLLNIIPRFGAQVAPIDFRYMKSVFEVTREIDSFAVRLAVARITKAQIEELEAILNRMKGYDIAMDYQKAITDDEHFHDILFQSSGNAPLAEILGNLHLHTERLWHYSQQYIDDMSIFTETLGKILDAIKAKDANRADQAAREHIDVFVEKIRQELL